MINLYDIKVIDTRIKPDKKNIAYSTEWLKYFAFMNIDYRIIIGPSRVSYRPNTFSTLIVA